MKKARIAATWRKCEEIAELNIPTAIPLVYELEDGMQPIRRYYLGDQEAVKKSAQSVADQVKKESHGVES